MESNNFNNFRWMEVYPPKTDDLLHIMRYAHDAVYGPFFGVYLYPPKNYYSHSLNPKRAYLG